MKSIRSLFLMLFFCGSILAGHAQVCPCDQATNLVVNGDFSSGNVGFTSDLPFAMACSTQTYGVGAEPRDKCANTMWVDDLWDHTVGNATGSYLIIDSQINDATVWSNSSPINVFNGVTYTFSFWHLRNISSSGGNIQFEIQVNGTSIGTINTTGAPATIWTQYCLTWMSNISGGATIEMVQLGPNGLGGFDHGVDDIYFGTCQAEACELEGTFDVEGPNELCSYQFTPDLQTNPFTTIVGYRWLFGDGNSSTEMSPVHTYLASGIYTVCLKVYAVNEIGECCEIEICQEIEVTCDPAPCEATINSITPSLPDPPVGSCPTLLDAFVSSVTRPIVGYFWNFGDGTTGSSPSSQVLHNYPADGTYEVCVTLILESGPDEECCAIQYCEEIAIFCFEGAAKATGEATGERLERSEEAEAENALGLFPNPAEHELRLVLQTEESRQATIVITGIDGRQVRMEQRSLGGGSLASLDISDLPAGMYIVSVQVGAQHYTRNWVKQ